MGKVVENKSNSKRGYLNEAFKIFNLKNREEIEIEPHFHDFCKVVIFVSGNVTYIIEGKSYNLRPWDILFINQFQIHKPIVDGSETYERIIIWIDPKEISKFNTENTNLLECFELASKQQFSLMRIPLKPLEKIKDQIQNFHEVKMNIEFGNDVLTNILLVKLLIMFNQGFLNQGKIKDGDVKYDERILKISEYINSHLQESLTIDEIAKNFFISKYHLMRKFKEQTGYSIHSYITQKRLILAKNYMDKGNSMMDVCFLSGFLDYSSFVRAFKKQYSVSPKKYYEKYNSFNLFENYTNE